MNYNPTDKEIDFVSKGLAEFNDKAVGPDNHELLNIVEYDDNGKVIAGILGGTYWTNICRNLSSKIKCAIKWAMLFLKMKNLLDFCVTIYSGTTHLFAQCCLWIDRHRKKVTAEN
ncbi:MAG: hypothetical protein KBS84_08485 [Treponema sp.]|nr:hypothetical protein [Candidatus Treponema scatequi]